MSVMSSMSRAAFAALPKSRLDMEMLAEKYIAMIYPANLISPTRLDVLDMMDRLEKHLGVVFGVQDLGLFEEGYTDPLNREIVIDTVVYYAAEQGDGRCRLTCCHEAGHIQHISQVRQIIRDGGPQLARRLNVLVPLYCDPEWQANAVAGALLMPRTTTPIIYCEGGIDAIVDYFRVSRAAAEKRVRDLKKLGCLN